MSREQSKPILLASRPGWCTLLLALLLTLVRPAAGVTAGPPRTRRFCCATGGVTAAGDLICDGDGFINPDFPDRSVEFCYNRGGAAITDNICKSVPDGPGAGGDPHITGFDGTDYLLVGKPNATYNLLSERNHQVNIQLFHPPSHKVEGLFINAVGLMIKGARIAVRLVPGPKGNEPAMAMTIYGAKELTLTWAGQPAQHSVDADTTVTFQSPERIAVASSDIFLSVVLVAKLHLDVHFEEVATSWQDVHGVMGRTYAAAFHRMKFNFARGTATGEMPSNKVAENKWLALEGTEDDYVTSGLLKADDKFSRFVGTASAVRVTRKLLAFDGDGAPSVKARCNAGVSSAAPVQPLSRHGRSLMTTYTRVCRPA